MHLVSYFRSLHTYCLRVQGVVCLVDQFFLCPICNVSLAKNVLQRLLIKKGCRRILYDLGKCKPI
ncbi:hypothetical protein PGF_00000450 [Porphyromonas gingivalis 381]|nr:hypothetical protein PGF_00000450 [Porphyromonas gingivalis 381]SJL20694.1 hypothetical protein PGIN_3-3_01831 [Porphyromonas gingivalis]